MKRLMSDVGFFFRSLRGCIAQAWQDTDCHYNIPKSRFQDQTHWAGSGDEVSEGMEDRENKVGKKKPVRQNAFLGSFRDCVVQAWEDTDTRYHIPKSQFQDLEHNETAYRTSRKGIWRRLSEHLRILNDCISTAWAETDHYRYVPRSFYQDPVFVREKVAAAPRLKGMPLLTPLPYGMGVVGLSSKHCWTVNPAGGQQDDVFFIPEDKAEQGWEVEKRVN